MERFQVFIIRGNDIFQTEEAVSLRLQFLLEKKEPFWMGEVACGEKLYSLYPGPVSKGIKDHLPGSGSGELRMNVKISYYLHKL